MQSEAETTALVAIVLSYYQDPIRRPAPFTAQRLPVSVTELLRIAAREAQAIPAALCEAHGVSARTLRAAALFFIEQVFFAARADHYRTLGVNPDADIAQIKKHHRLLIGLFHPDRGSGDSWGDVYAERLNRAYRVLRNPASRAAYDHGLRSP